MHLLYSPHFSLLSFSIIIKNLNMRRLSESCVYYRLSNYFRNSIATPALAQLVERRTVVV